MPGSHFWKICFNCSGYGLDIKSFGISLGDFNAQQSLRIIGETFSEDGKVLDKAWQNFSKDRRWVTASRGQKEEEGAAEKHMELRLKSWERSSQATQGSVGPDVDLSLMNSDNKLFKSFKRLVTHLSHHHFF